MNTDPETKLAHQRLRVLELAKVLGKVNKACWRWKWDTQKYGSGEQRSILRI